VVTYGATCGSAESTMTSHMTGNAAYDRALDTAFGIGRGCDRQKRHQHAVVFPPDFPPNSSKRDGNWPYQMDGSALKTLIIQYVVGLDDTGRNGPQRFGKPPFKT
jgi:hypothetical protein